MTLFAAMDVLKAEWCRLDALLCKRPEAKWDGFPLSVERAGGKMCIHYGGRPIRECGVREVIAAADFANELVIRLQEEDYNRARAAEKAIGLVAEAIERVEIAKELDAEGEE